MKEQKYNDSFIIKKTKELQYQLNDLKNKVLDMQNKLEYVRLNSEQNGVDIEKINKD